MAKFLVKNSPPLRGEVEVSGAKNAVLPILAATLLSEDTCRIEGVPDLKDVTILCSLLSSLGIKVERNEEEGAVSVNAANILINHAPEELVKMMRASILVMGPLLARTGKAVINLPGGCAIGERPVELHFKGFKAMGAEVEISEDGEIGRASCRERV